MKNRFTLLVTLLLMGVSSFLMPTNTFGQLDSCDASVPFFDVDLSGTPDSVWTSPHISRDGQCCGAANNENCISFQVTLDSNAAGIQIDMIGADPQGSLFWDIDCQGNYPGGTVKCISGPGPHNITFCKPGNNKNSYIISSISAPLFPENDTTRLGCSKRLEVLGVKDSSNTTWTSIYPGNDGDYNHYLSCDTGCTDPLFTPDGAAPSYVDYLVCGDPIASGCGYALNTCDTVRVYILDSLKATISPDPAFFCDNGSGSGVWLTANATGGDGDHSYTWLDGNQNPVGTDSSSIFAEFEQTYTVIVKDGLFETTYCPGYETSTSVTVGQPPVVDAGSDTTVCSSSPGSYLNGTVNNAVGGIWTGGYGTFSPNDSTLVASYTPTQTEIANGSVTLTLTSYGAGGGCPNDSDKVVIYYPDTLKSSMDNDTLTCNGDLGTLTPTLTGGQTPMNYQWSTGAIGASLTAPEGNYCVTITDVNGCQTTTCANIVAPSPLSLSMSSTDVSTNGGSDGSATTSPSGGTSPYSYSWSNGGTTQTITNLSYGVYTVTVTDANGCIISSSIVVNEPRCSSFDVTASSTDITCFGDSNGTATSSVLGGTTPYTYQWNDPLSQTTANADSLPAGTWTVEVTDFNGCVAVANVTISQPSPLSNTIIYSDVTTGGGSDGSATANPSGGTPIYYYNWSNGGTTQTINNLTTGVYYLGLSDDNGCSLQDSVQINEPPCDEFKAYVNTTKVSCYGGSDGTASVQIINGTSPYSFNWSTGATSSSISGLAAGSYSVIVTDANNCSTFKTFSISQPSPLSIGANPNMVSCNGANDGTIDITVSGGTYPYSFSWADGKSSEDRYDLSPGTYFVTVTDNNGCTVSGSATITEPDSLRANSNVSGVSCYGSTDGSIDLTVTGGTLPYSYQWDDGATSQDRSGLEAGSYSVTVTDGNNCQISSNTLLFGVTQPDSLYVDTVISDCPSPGVDTTEIHVQGIGGTRPYQVSTDNGSTWNSAGDTSIFVSVNAAYDILLMDANGCVSQAPYTHSVNDNVSITGISFDPCYSPSATDTTVSVSVSGGDGGPFSVSFDNGSTFTTPGDLQENLAVGSTYYIVAKDGEGCLSLTDTITLPDPLDASAAITSDHNGQDISCNGATDGEAEVTPIGGTSPYSYNWSNGDNDATLDNVGAGTYYVTITDASGCSVQDSVTITEPVALNSSTSVISDYNGQAVSCNGATDGEAMVSISGGTMPYSYSWSIGGTDDTLNNVGAGTYYVTVTDVNGCSIQDSITLTEPTLLSSSISVTSDYNGQNVSCNGASDGEATVTANGGTAPYSYSWSNGDNDATLDNVAAGTYYVTATDVNGCSVQDSITITEPVALNSSTSVISDYNGQDVSCNGATDGEAMVSVSGGTMPYSYSWITGGTNDTLSNIGAGTYYVTITDANGCSVQDSITLTEPIQLTSATSVTTDYNGQDISCFGATDGDANITANGGTAPYSYSWSNGDNDALMENVGAGTYYVTVTDANGCSVQDSITLTEPTDISTSTSVISDYNGQDISCTGAKDGQATVSASGGTAPYSYSWSPGGSNDTISNLGAGTYYVTITDVNGCTVQDSVTLEDPLSMTSTTTVISDHNGQDVSCNGATDGKAMVSISGGTMPYSYSWNTGGTDDTLSNVGTGTYYVTVTDVNGCSIQDSVTLTEPVALSSSTSVTSDHNGQNVSCNGAIDGEAMVSISGGTMPYSYSWNTGGSDDTLSNVGAGTYYVTVTDVNGCSIQDSITLTEPALLTSSTSITTDYNGQDVSCNGASDGEATVAANGGTAPYSYSWSNGDNDATLNNVGAGTYYVTVTDVNGCTVQDSVILTEPAALSSSTTVTSDYNGQNVSCNGASDGEAMVSATGGTAPYSYAWSNGTNDDTLSNVWQELTM